MNAIVPIAQLARILHSSNSRWRALAVLEAYFDESGTHDGATIVSMGGLVGSADAWAAIEGPWQSVLSEYSEKGVRFFHMTECVNQTKQFSLIEKPHINYIITQLSQVLKDKPLSAIFSAVVIDHWNRVVTDAEFLFRFPTPLALCFDDIVRGLSLWSAKHTDGELVAPVFAYRTEYASGKGIGGDVLKLYGSQDWYKNSLAAIAFDYPERVIPLQAADLVSHQMNWEIQGRVGLRSRRGTKALNWATSGRFIHGHWFNGPALKLTVNRFQQTGEIYPMGEPLSEEQSS